jgi:hypothetical protein
VIDELEIVINLNKPSLHKHYSLKLDPFNTLIVGVNAKQKVTII